MSTTYQVDSTLVRTPGVCGGRLRIDGTRITLNQVATLYQRGESAEEIASHYPHLSLAQVYGALAYYHAHRDEVASELADELAEAERLEHASQQPLLSPRRFPAQISGN